MGRFAAVGVGQTGAVLGVSVAGAQQDVFDEVEAGIDDLIFRLKLAGGAPEVEAKLREVRRSLHPSVR